MSSVGAFRGEGKWEGRSEVSVVGGVAQGWGWSQDLDVNPWATQPNLGHARSLGLAPAKYQMQVQAAP